MVHNIALVLGGGGAAGQAWQIGVIAGLAEAGLDLTEAADLVIGTSSGSTTAAHVRSETRYRKSGPVTAPDQRLAGSGSAGSSKTVRARSEEVGRRWP
jgi:patatin-like phospholipase/acyl hydrolase